MSDILASRDGGVMAIEFNRPQRKNALTAEMYSLLIEALREAESDTTVRVVRRHTVPRGSQGSPTRLSRNARSPR